METPTSERTTATAKRDVDLIAERLKAAERDYEENYGKQKR